MRLRQILRLIAREKEKDHVGLYDKVKNTLLIRGCAQLNAPSFLRGGSFNATTKSSLGYDEAMRSY